MSDFDKEAEREKLREKYGEEEEKREATEQMSELLLKGATMTNAHCTDCGDPIFRYDGQEFCPTCQKPVARDRADGEDDGESGDHIEVADPSDEATVQFGDGQDGADAQSSPTADASQPTSDGTRPTDTGTRPTADTAREVPSADPGRTPDTAQSPSAPDVSDEPTRPDTVSTELSAAESLLAETVHRFAARAAETDDPRAAREHLVTAREAAEALDAVRF